MRVRSLEITAAALFLIICLAAGLILAEMYAPRPIIGVVRFEGLIDSTSAQQMGAILDAAREDERVAGVVMEINSGGGDVASSEKLYHVMLQLRQRKPLVVSVDGMALSGGYYMAIAGDKLYATSGASVGSVGALTIRPFDPQIWPGLLSTGPYKLSGGSRFDQVQQLELSKEAFVSSVIAHRSQSAYNPLRIDARTLAEAHIYLGSEGLAIGLVDAQGSRSDAIIAAGELAGVKDYQVVELSDYLGLPFEPSLDVFSLIEGALPGTVFFLDSRIPLAADVRDKLTRHALYPIGSERQAPTPNHEGSR